MKSLITPAQVVAEAFKDGEYLSAEALGVADIAAAEHVWIEPILGAQLYARLMEGDYASLVEEYVAPALAMAVRVVVQPSLNVRTGQAGLAAAMPDAASDDAAKALHSSLRHRRHLLLKRLSDYLSANAERYPEYDARGDIMQKCSINGGFVQIL